MMIIIGTNGGLGRGLLEAFEAQSHPSFGRIVGLTRKDIDIADPVAVSQYWSKLDAESSPGEQIFVVNAAGRSINGYCDRLAQSDWDITVSDNLTSNFMLIKALAPVFKKRPGSSILLLSSVVPELGVPGTIAYSATKSGLRGMVRTASKELSRSKATINCLELGYFDRGMIEQVPSEHVAKLVDEIPLRRLGSIEDLAMTCEYALRCTYLTGAVIKLNGGLT